METRKKKEEEGDTDGQSGGAHLTGNVRTETATLKLPWWRCDETALNAPWSRTPKGARSHPHCPGADRKHRLPVDLCSSCKLSHVITSCAFAQCNIAISRRSSNLIYPYYPVCSNVAAFRIISKGSVRFTRAAEWKTCVTRPEPSSTEPRSEATGPGKTCATAMLSRWPAIRCTSTKDRPKFRCDRSPGTACRKQLKTMIFWLLSNSNISNSHIQNMSK